MTFKNKSLTNSNKLLHIVTLGHNSSWHSKIEVGRGKRRKRHASDIFDYDQLRNTDLKL